MVAVSGRSRLNLLVDLLATLCLLAMIASGYALWFALPPGSERTHSLWGVVRSDWGRLHAYASLGLVGLLALHLALHWRWLVAQLCARRGLHDWRERHPHLASAAAGAILLLPLIGFALAARFGVRPLPQRPASEPITVVAAFAERDRLVGLLLERCAGCHGEARAAAGVRADTPEILLAEQEGVRWVVLGDLEGSRLFEVLLGEDDPRPGLRAHRLAADELALLRHWIGSGG